MIICRYGSIEGCQLGESWFAVYRRGIILIYTDNETTLRQLCRVGYMRSTGG